MDETVNQIEAHIDRTRERLGSNLRELEGKVEAATDWRTHFEQRPHLFLGGAFAGGILLATLIGSSGSRPGSPMGGQRRRERPDDASPRRFALGGGSTQQQAFELWDNVKNALVGVATERIREYIGGLVPGFDEQYHRLAKPGERHA